MCEVSDPSSLPQETEHCSKLLGKPLLNALAISPTSQGFDNCCSELALMINLLCMDCSSFTDSVTVIMTCHGKKVDALNSSDPKRPISKNDPALLVTVCGCWSHSSKPVCNQSRKVSAIASWENLSSRHVPHLLVHKTKSTS
jgi:hypothetical protein